MTKLKKQKVQFQWRHHFVVYVDGNYLALLGFAKMPTPTQIRKLKAYYYKKEFGIKGALIGKNKKDGQDD